MINYVKFTEHDSSMKQKIIDDKKNGMSSVSVQRQHNITDKTFYRVLREEKNIQCNA